jgi:hypothetical protein
VKILPCQKAGQVVFTCRLIFTKLVDRAGNQTDTTYWSQIVKTMAITFKGERKIQTRILKRIKQFKALKK